MKRIAMATVTLAVALTLTGYMLTAADDNPPAAPLSPGECRDLFSDVTAMPQQTPTIDSDGVWHFDPAGDGFYSCGR